MTTEEMIAATKEAQAPARKMTEQEFLEYYKAMAAEYVPAKLTDVQKQCILAARLQFVLEDPYPEIAKWQQENEFSFKWFKKKLPYPGPNAHKAWMDGFNFAWGLIENRLK
jgi:hypothetical protein